MSVNLVLLKSGEEIVADVKEIKSEGNVVGYFFCLLYTSDAADE